MKLWALTLGLSCLPSFAAEVRVLEPANRSYSGALEFIQSNGRLQSDCISMGDIVFRNAPFSLKTIKRMQQRASSMGADTLLIKDTTIGPVNYDYVIRMGLYRCKAVSKS
jgi:hypothetical protein